jgi:hypothetical protein
MAKAKDYLNENLISLLGLEALASDKKEAMLERMTDLVQKRLMLGLMKELSIEEGQALEKAIEAEPKKALDFLGDRFPDLEKRLIAEVAKLKEELATAVKS